MGPVDTSGRVVDVQGRPVAGATVQLVQGARPLQAGTTDAGGRYRLSGGVRALAAQVAVTAPGYLPRTAAVRPALVVHRRPQVQGRAVDETGAAVPYARVAVELAGGAMVETMTDGEGFYNLNRALEPGSALVTITAPGHDAAGGRVQLEADRVEQVASTLTRQLAFLDIATTPPGQPVTLDGAPLAGCEKTPCTVPAAAGNHVLGIAAEPYEPWSEPVALWEGTHLSAAVSLVRKTGTLSVTAPGGAGSSLLLDGRPISPGGWSGTVPSGPHALTFTAPGLWPWSAGVDVGWNTTTSATVAALPMNPGTDAQFTANLSAYLGSLPGHYSVYIGDLAGGRSIRYHASDVMEAASVIKLPLAIYVEAQAQSGALKMDDQVTLEDDDFLGGTGTLYGSAKSGDKYSYKDLVALLVQQSDNTAWQALKRVLGADKIDAFTAAAGAGDCHQQVDDCSAGSAGLLTGRLAAGQLLDADHTRDLMTLLETTAFNDRINAYLPNLTIAHKVGMDGGVINDTGAVLGRHPFVVSVFTDSADPDQGAEVIRLVARAAGLLFGT